MKMKGVHWYAITWAAIIGGLWAIKIGQPGLFVGALIGAAVVLALALQKGPLLEQFQYEFRKERPPLWRCPLLFVTEAGALTTFALVWPEIRRLLIAVGISDGLL